MNTKRICKTLILSTLCIATTASYAFEIPPNIKCLENCEPIAETAPIVEENMIDRMKREASKVDWQKINKQIIKNADEATHNFKPVYPLTTPKKDQTKFIDPTVIATKDIWGYRPKKGLKLTQIKSMDDMEETIVVHKGQRMNPLDFVKPQQVMFIYDPTSKEQLNLAKKLLHSKIGKRLMLIASQGDIAGMRKETGRHNFYLTNELQKRLQLLYTPSLVDIKENKIRVRSFALPFSVKKILENH